MSQNEVYEILKDKRLSGDDRFFNQQQISKSIIEGVVARRFVGSASVEIISKDLKRLHHWGIIEKCNIKGTTHYRIKKKLLEEG